jgi:hypothetical protein
MAKTRPAIKTAFKILPSSNKRRIKKVAIPRAIKNPFLELTKIIAKVKNNARNKFRKKGKYNPGIKISFIVSGSIK